MAFLAESNLYLIPPVNISPKTEIGTFFALVEIPNTSSGFNTIFSSRLSSNTNFLGHRVYFIGGPSGAVLDYTLGNNTGDGTAASQYRQFRTSEIFQANKLYAVAICSRSLSTGSCYVNGVNATLTTAGTATNFVRGNGSYIGASPTTSSNAWFIYAYAVWDRALTDGELSSITSNPSQLFQKKSLSVPTYYPILSNLQATRGNTSAALRTNINY